MLRFITDPLLQRSVLVMLYHPLSQKARSTLIAMKPPPLETVSELIKTASETKTPECSEPEAIVVVKEKVGSVAAVALDLNPFGDTLKQIAATGAPGNSNQKLVLTSIFMFHLLCTGLISGNPSRTVEGDDYFASDLLSALQMVRLLQCMDILPSDGDCSCLDEDVSIEVTAVATTNDIVGKVDSNISSNAIKSDRHKSHRNSRKLPYNAVPLHSYDADPDLLSLDTLRKIRLLSGGEADEESCRRPLLAVYMDVLRFPGNHSLTAFQVIKPLSGGTCEFNFVIRWPRIVCSPSAIWSTTPLSQPRQAVSKPAARPC
jgi:hypothetical protein